MIKRFRHPAAPNPIYLAGYLLDHYPKTDLSILQLFGQPEE